MARLVDGKTSEEVRQYLRNISFPARKDQVVHAARQSGAPDDIVYAFQNLSKNDFASADELIEVYGTM